MIFTKGGINGRFLLIFLGFLVSRSLTLYPTELRAYSLISIAREGHFVKQKSFDKKRGSGLLIDAVDDAAVAVLHQAHDPVAVPGRVGHAGDAGGHGLQVVDVIYG